MEVPTLACSPLVRNGLRLYHLCATLLQGNPLIWELPLKPIAFGSVPPNALNKVVEVFYVNFGLGDFLFRLAIHLGVRANVQPKSNIPIGAKVEINPKGFTLGVKADIKKKSIYL